VGVVVVAVVILFVFFVDKDFSIFLKKNLSREVYIFFSSLTEYGRAVYYLVPVGIICLISWILFYFKKSEKIKSLGEKTLFIFIAISACGLFVDILKPIFGRWRPRQLVKDGSYGFEFFEFKEELFSFPSGHTSNMISFITAIFLITPKKYRIFLSPLFIYALLMLISRLVINAHYISDLIFSTYLAIFITISIHSLLFHRGYLVRLGQRIKGILPVQS